MMSDEAGGGAQALARYCVHYGPEVPGAYYGGAEYVAALQLLRASAAVRAAGKVESFFWRDAPKVRVWLCQECAAELGVSAAPPGRPGEGT